MQATHKKIVIHIAGPSCSGKSSLANALATSIPEIYLLSYDKLKWQLAGYHRDKHSALIRKIALGLFETICNLGLPTQMDFVFTDQNEYAQYANIAKKNGYNFIFIGLTSPREILVDRFRKRIEDAKKNGEKISVTDEALYIKNLENKFYTPKQDLFFDTTLISPNEIAYQIVTQASFR